MTRPPTRRQATHQALEARLLRALPALSRDRVLWADGEDRLVHVLFSSAAAQVVAEALAETAAGLARVDAALEAMTDVLYSADEELINAAHVSFVEDLCAEDFAVFQRLYPRMGPELREAARRMLDGRWRA